VVQVVRMVEQWAQLPRESLVTAVVAAVRQPPADPTRLWRAVQADPVLAATVRGILSGVLREKEGTRDEVYWTYRVNTVRAVLNATEPSTEPTVGPSGGSRAETRQAEMPQVEALQVESLPVDLRSVEARSVEVGRVVTAAPAAVPMVPTPPQVAPHQPVGAQIPGIEFQSPGY
jgi:hypothetical protein